jgi:rubrerythrin
MSSLSESDSLDFEKTVGYVLQEAAKAEWQFRRLYLKFSEMFSHISQVSTFWGELAQDEEEHARVLQKIQEHLTNKQLAKAAKPELLANIEKVPVILRNISLDSIDTLDDAYEVAHEMEFSEVNSVFKVLASEFVSNKTRMEATISQLVYHQGKLMQFNENIGDRSWRKGITVKRLIHQG